MFVKNHTNFLSSNFFFLNFNLKSVSAFTDIEENLVKLYKRQSRVTREAQLSKTTDRISLSGPHCACQWPLFSKPTNESWLCKWAASKQREGVFYKSARCPLVKQGSKPAGLERLTSRKKNIIQLFFKSYLGERTSRKQLSSRGPVVFHTEKF